MSGHVLREDNWEDVVSEIQRMGQRIAWLESQVKWAGGQINESVTGISLIHQELKRAQDTIKVLERIIQKGLANKNWSK